MTLAEVGYPVYFLIIMIILKMQGSNQVVTPAGKLNYFFLFF